MNDRDRNDGTDARFDLSLSGHQWELRSLSEALSSGGSNPAIRLVLVVGLLLATVCIGYTIAAPGDGDRSTAFFLLTRNESGGLVAENYPTEFTCGESKSLVIGITNYERVPIEYTAVVKTQRVRFGNNGTSTTVLDSRELRRVRVSVLDNETRYVTYNTNPALIGENVRLTFLLYKRGIPPEPTVANAYRSLHLGVTVAPADPSSLNVSRSC